MKEEEERARQIRLQRQLRARIAQEEGDPEREKALQALRRNRIREVECED